MPGAAGHRHIGRLPGQAGEAPYAQFFKRLLRRPISGESPFLQTGTPGLCEKVLYGASRQIMFWGCVKSLFSALRAKFKFETDAFFMILRSKIMKNTSVSKEYSAAAGGKNLFSQPPTFTQR
jgi:hypothetical protein